MAKSHFPKLTACRISLLLSGDATVPVVCYLRSSKNCMPTTHQLLMYNYLLIFLVSSYFIICKYIISIIIITNFVTLYKIIMINA